MAKNRLTDLALRKAKPKNKEYEMSDGDGLSLRVKPDGSCLWCFRYVSPTTGRRVRDYLGVYPILGLREARELLQERRKWMALGADPRFVIQPPGDGQETAAIPKTVAQLFRVWFERDIAAVRVSKGDLKSIEGRFKNYIAPVMGDLPLPAVRRAHVMQVIDKARSAGHLPTANKLVAEQRQMFGFAVVREWMQGDPTAGIKRKDAGGTDAEGERVLADEEIVQLRDVLARPPMQKSRYYVSEKRVLPVRTELMLWWTLATLARAVEVASLRMDAVNVKTRHWLIGADVAKNKKPHVVHLSDFALAVWARIECLERVGVYAFDGRDGGHLSRTEVTRRLSDRQTRNNPVQGRKNSRDLDLPGGHWTQHDLRRTGATIMGELGIAKEVIDRCLNHKEAKRVTRTYQRQQMMPQRQEAFEALGAHLTALLGAPDRWLPEAG